MLTESATMPDCPLLFTALFTWFEKVSTAATLCGPKGIRRSPNNAAPSAIGITRHRRILPSTIGVR
jgi:hypothetical protein